MSNSKTIVIIGGGAAGFFGAITAAEANPDARVILLEKARQVLSKVRISGGGRCNVTHSCFDPAALVQNYPRGHKALRGPFTKFQPRDTINWFAARGVNLKTEEDGRMFPNTDNSETIINCLLKAARGYEIEIKTECGVTNLEQKEKGFLLTLSNSETLFCDKLLIATGSANKVYSWLEALGHKIQPPVPSLFTFNIPTSPFKEIAGISVPRVNLEIEQTPLKQSGPLLITHWGFSGPAVLKLSAWGARLLHDKDYRAKLHLNWLPDYTIQELKDELLRVKVEHPIKLVLNETPFELPKNLWKVLVTISGIPDELRWSSITKQQVEKLIHHLNDGVYQIEGKTTFKEEFVTCGGVDLDEVNFKTMESKKIPNLFFAGEVLDIDGVTGGFNFQNAWTTAWLAGTSM
jgi:predicted Rossmann fold flavoprotein